MEGINKIIQGDCLEVMKTFPDNSIDAIITDPPYGLSFMGKKWDYDVPSVDIWKEALRVLKPGGYLLSFAGTRTQHRMAVRIEDAGFEIRDMIAWVYGSGFPKSLNIGKAVNKLQGTEYPKNTLISENSSMSGGNYTRYTREIESEIAKEWEGWGTALKPALEPITVARKPLSEKTVVENCLKWGVGGIDIDGCRVKVDANEKESFEKEWDREQSISAENGGVAMNKGLKAVSLRGNVPTGRFPANLIHDGSDEVVSLFPNTKSGARSSNHKIGNDDGEMFNHGIYGKYKAKNYDDAPADSGSAARFFYCAKASKSERNMGCEELPEKLAAGLPIASADGERGGEAEDGSSTDRIVKMRNFHPTVKPIALMEYLVKLVSREGAIILDPFTGSGSTLIACKKLKRNYIGIEMNPEYCEIAKKRIESVSTISQAKFLEE